MFRVTQALVVTLYAILGSAKTVTYDFDIGWVTAAPDGFSRPVIGINGQWPIPMIEADVGDTIVVNARNSLGNETTSLHFHGMFQQGTQSFDGASSVTQCPIQPGGSFTYTFIANPAGTHWYHSHEKGQYPDGLRGKMIIHDKAWEDSLKIDEQIYLSLSDWYHRQMPDILTDYMSSSNTNGRFPSPDTVLFNDTNTPFDLTFKPGKKYLLRIVNTGAVACGQFSLQNYTMTVVEADGVPMQPQNADSIVICAGQSYGVTVQGKMSPVEKTKYLIELSTDMLTDAAPSESSRRIIGQLSSNFDTLFDDLLGGIGATVPESPALPPPGPLNDFLLKPLDNQALLGPATRKIDLVTNQTFFQGIGTRTGLGVHPWVPAKVPTLFTALTTGEAASDPATYGPGANPWVVKSGDVVQIYLQNDHGFPHPMHLHGHIFQIVAVGTGKWNGDESSFPAVPAKRDGHVVPANGYSVIRFVADNPGVWFYHCHIDLHFVAGMAMTLIEAPEKLAQGSVPPASIAMCAAGGFKASGNCNGDPGPISAAQAATQCNNVYNFHGVDHGALIAGR